MNEKLQQAVNYIKSGNKRATHALLIEIIRADPNSPDAEIAWLWMSVVMKDPAKKRRSLENALAINPRSEIAKQKLAEIDSTSSQSKASSENIASSRYEPETTKKCPYCAETIKTKAIVCRFCGKDLRVSTTGYINASPRIIQSSGGSVAKDIKDIGKTATGVAFGIFSAPFISLVLLIGVIVFCCFGCAFLNSLGSLGIPSQATSPTSTLVIPSTYTPAGNPSTSGIQNYIDQRNAIGEAWLLSSYSVDWLLQELESNPSLWYDDNWVTAMGMALSIRGDANQQVREIRISEIPAGYEASHNELLKTADAYDDMIEYFEQWLITGDDYYVERIGSAIERADQHLDLSGALLP